MTMEHKREYMKWNSLLVALSVLFIGRAQVLDHVEPANWWVGMEHHQVQVLLHGTDIAKYNVDVLGLNILEEIRTENPNYIFITLETANKVAGNYLIELKDKKKVIIVEHDNQEIEIACAQTEKIIKILLNQ